MRRGRSPDTTEATGPCQSNGPGVIAEHHLRLGMIVEFEPAALRPHVTVLNMFLSAIRYQMYVARARHRALTARDVWTSARKALGLRIRELWRSDPNFHRRFGGSHIFEVHPASTHPPDGKIEPNLPFLQW